MSPLMPAGVYMESIPPVVKDSTAFFFCRQAKHSQAWLPLEGEGLAGSCHHHCCLTAPTPDQGRGGSAMFPPATDGTEAQGQHEGPFGVARKRRRQQQSASWVCMADACLPAGRPPFQSRVGSATAPWSPAQPSNPSGTSLPPAAAPTWKGP